MQRTRQARNERSGAGAGAGAGGGRAGRPTRGRTPGDRGRERTGAGGRSGEAAYGSRRGRSAGPVQRETGERGSFGRRTDASHADGERKTTARRVGTFRSDRARIAPVGDRSADGRATRATRRPRGADEVPLTQSEMTQDYIVGRHPVLEALKAGRTINKMLVAEGAEGGSLAEIMGKAKAAGLLIQRVPRAKLDQIAGPHHQGVLLYVSPHDYAELDDIISRRTGHPPLVLLLDEVEDPYNLGAVLRTAEATGVAGVVIPKRRSVPLTGVVAKVAAGAVEHVPVARVTNLVQAMERLKKEGYWIVGADASATQMYTHVDYAGPTAIVIGAEGKGLSRLVRERCDHLVKLPMLGTLQSLNASVATGVLLYEVVRQRG